MAKVTRITAPGIPNPAPEETVHEALPILHNDDPHYHELLELLRRDLQLDSAVDLVPPTDGGYNQGIQAGRVALTLTAGGVGTPASNTFNLPHAWRHAHDAFVAIVVAGPAWPTYYGSDTHDLKSGIVWLSATASGTYVVNWFSKGH